MAVLLGDAAGTLEETAVTDGFLVEELQFLQVCDRETGLQFRQLPAMHLGLKVRSECDRDPVGSGLDHAVRHGFGESAADVRGESVTVQAGEQADRIDDQDLGAQQRVVRRFSFIIAVAHRSVPCLGEDRIHFAPVRLEGDDEDLALGVGVGNLDDHPVLDGMGAAGDEHFLAVAPRVHDTVAPGLGGHGDRTVHPGVADKLVRQGIGRNLAPLQFVQQEGPVRDAAEDCFLRTDGVQEAPDVQERVGRKEKGPVHAAISLRQLPDTGGEHRQQDLPFRKACARRFDDGPRFFELAQ